MSFVEMLMSIYCEKTTKKQNYQIMVVFGYNTHIYHRED